jgi:hypothetical protein
MIHVRNKYLSVSLISRRHRIVLSNDALSCSDLLAIAAEEIHWQGKREHSQESLPPCPFVYREPHTYWPGIEYTPPWWEAGNWPPHKWRRLMLGRNLLKYYTKANKQAYRYSERDLKSQHTDRAIEISPEKNNLKLTSHTFVQKSQA